MPISSSLPFPTLPIDEAMPRLLAALADHRSVLLQAPPGAGKTTHVPLALLREEWLAGGKIVMLEPRRLAARAAARRMADLLGEEVGGTVGYRMRMETRVGRSTRIEVVTEGILSRMIQSDPALEGIGILIFDEFHERSLQADLGLALAHQTQSLLREDLRLLVMSATLDGEPIARLLDDAPIVTSQGRMFPVETRYLARRNEGRIEDAAAAAVLRALAEEKDGDILVFLPGAGEIRRVEDLLSRSPLPAGTLVAPLHGNLPQGAQDTAIAPSVPGRRKVVLSTSIAETSLTIEGIRIVIDAGLMRVPRFSPRAGMTRLATVRVTVSSAEQRRGRAGRLGPGVCYRLWTEGEQGALLAQGQPEIMEADLAPLALELAEWGVSDPAELAWLTPPPAGAYTQGRDLLTRLDAIDAGGAITPHGRAMARLALHPRLAHMTLAARELGQATLACRLAALLEERDPFRSFGAPPDADVRLRMEALVTLDRGNGPASAHGHEVDRGTLRRIAVSARAWERRLGLGDREEGMEIEACGLLLAFAYPDRIAQMRPGQPGRFLLRNGQSAALPKEQTLAASAFLVAAELDGDRRESRIFLAAPIDMEEIELHFGDQIESESIVAWDDQSGTVMARRRERLGALALRDLPVADPDPELMARAYAEGIRREGLGLLPWSKGAVALRERMAFLHGADGSWPDVSDAALLETLESWLAPHLGGLRRKDDLARLDLHEILMALLTWEQRARLEELAPSHLTVPSGSRIPIDYSTPEAPVLAVRLQEMSGAVETPRVGGGRVPLTIHLLSPAGRPVQVTRDLANFWRTTYFDVRKDLKGRYPKHYWPDDPLQATPTNRAKPRGT